MSITAVFCDIYSHISKTRIYSTLDLQLLEMSNTKMKLKELNVSQILRYAPLHVANSTMYTHHIWPHV